MASRLADCAAYAPPSRRARRRDLLRLGGIVAVLYGMAAVMILGLLSIGSGI